MRPIDYRLWCEAWEFDVKNKVESQAFDETFDKNSDQEYPSDFVNSLPILFLRVMIMYQNKDNRKIRN